MPQAITLTKLHPPPVSPDILTRDRLTEQLNAGRQRPLTLISAPAGYGKSTLASRWVAACECPSGWISLDTDDGDPRVFLSYVLAAIQTAFPKRNFKTQALLDAPELPLVSVLARSLLNDLEKLDEAFILVLDDYHHIQEAPVHALVTELLTHPPPALHLVLVTRQDPPLPITTLRARGQVTEIRASDLRFTLAETRAFLRKMAKTPVDDVTAAALERKTEGWVTGLRLAVLSVRDQEDLDRVRDLRGDFHYIAEYLVSEVLSRQPPLMAAYMLEVSLLDRFCGPLCEAIHQAVETDDSQAVEPSAQEFIEWLIKSDLFVIPLDEQHHWFRYHQLFQQLLRSQLKRRRHPENIARFHARASVWFEGQGMIEEAIRHAVASGDADAAAGILVQHRHAELDRNRWYVVDKWLSLLPVEIRQQRPDLLMAYAHSLWERFRVPDVLPVLAQVKPLLAGIKADDALAGEWHLRHGQVLLTMRGDSRTALQHFEEARKRTPASHQTIAGEAEMYLALSRQMTGDEASALAVLEERIAATDSNRATLLARLIGAQIFVHFLSGNLPAAMRATHRLDALGRCITYIDAWVHYLRGNAQLQSYELDAALQDLCLAAQRPNVFSRKAAIDAQAGLVLISQALSRSTEAVNLADQSLEFARETGDPHHLAVAESCRARLWLAQGDMDPAIRWARSFVAEPHPPAMFLWIEVPAITQARVQVAAGTKDCLEKAFESLQSLRERVDRVHNRYQTLEILVLQSVALEKMGRLDEAIAVLGEALILAEPGGWIRPFVESGASTFNLLNHSFERNVNQQYLTQVLAAFRNHGSRAVLDTLSKHPVSPTSDPRSFVAPLTKREEEVLRLLAERLSDKEIATRLFVSAETVRSHVKHIYQKLQVTNRREAAAKAEAAGLLDRS